MSHTHSKTEDTEAILLTILDASADFERLLGDEWSIPCEELVDFILRLDTEEETTSLRQEIDALPIPPPDWVVNNRWTRTAGAKIG